MLRAHTLRENTHRLHTEGTGLFGDRAQASRTQMRRGDRQDEEKGHMDAEEVRDVEQGMGGVSVDAESHRKT